MSVSLNILLLVHTEVHFLLILFCFARELFICMYWLIKYIKIKAIPNAFCDLTKKKHEQIN